MFRNISKKRSAIIGLVASLVVAAAAIAYFSSTGNGTGSATVGSATAFTVGQTGTPTGGPLYPDTAIGTGNIQTNPYTVANPSKGNQNLNKVVISVATAANGVWTAQADAAKPACKASDFSVGGQAVGTAWTDTALSGDFTTLQSKTGSVTVQLIDNGANQDNCQGVTVPLYLSAS